MIKDGNDLRSLLLLAAMVMLPLSGSAAETHSHRSSQRMDVLIQRIVEEPFPVGFSLFAGIGASQFQQEGRSDSANIAFRSAPILSSDGIEIEFVEFRIAPYLTAGTNFLYVQLAQTSCYPLSGLRKKYGMKAFFAPPNPHAPAGQKGGNRLLYRAENGQTSLVVQVDGTPRECVLSVARSRS